MHSITYRRTYRQTDTRQDHANSRSYCVAVRSAKKYEAVRTFVLVELRVEVVESCDDKIIDKADLVTKILHFN